MRAARGTGRDVPHRFLTAMGVPVFLLALLGAAAALVMRRRIRDYVGGTTVLDDDMIRRIEEQGVIEVEEPLDLEQVREEEERFWSETWDIPDED